MKTLLDTKSISTEENTPTYQVVTTKPVNKSFYSFYLEEHQNVISRRLHFAGSSFGLIGFAAALKTGRLSPVLKGIAAGYACAWVGHFFFEKNKPATFKYPVQSFISDFRMYSDILRGNVSLKDPKFDKVS